MQMPIIKPAEVKEYIFRQSKYAIAPKLPVRSVVLGPSGSGKSVLLQSMILDIYRGSFDQIYIFSPSVEVDDTIWGPIKKYIDEKVNILKERSTSTTTTRENCSRLSTPSGGSWSFRKRRRTSSCTKY